MLAPSPLSELHRLAGWEPPHGSPEPVAGGLTHRVYRVRTDRGDFAVKAISPMVAAYDGIRERLRRAERTASAVAASGLPSVPALEIAGETVHELGGSLLIAYPWVDGKTLPNGSSPGPMIGGIVGDLVGKIHALDLASGSEPPSRQSGRSVDWEPLVAEGEAKGSDWSADARGALPDLRAWDEMAREARERLGYRWVVAHCDLDQKNVLWSDVGTPWTVDWESAGPIHPAKEIVAAALDWSGHGQDVETFRSVLRAYRAHAELSSAEARLGLGAYFDWLGWLEHSMRRSVGLTSDDAEERTIGTQEATATLRALKRFAASLTTLEHACAA